MGAITLCDRECNKIDSCPHPLKAHSHGSIFCLRLRFSLYQKMEYMSRSSLQTTQHPAADGCGVVVHTTCTHLTARTLVISWIDLRGYRAVSAHFPTNTRSGSPLDVTCSDVTPPPRAISRLLKGIKCPPTLDRRQSLG